MRLQLKRSNVLTSGSAKTPTASQLEYGELAINYNTNDPAIFLKDSNNNVIRISGVGNIADDGQVELPASTTPPSNPQSGNLWYNSDDGRLYIYYTDADSSQWVDASPDSWDPTVLPDTTNNSSQSGTLDDRYLMLNAANDPITGGLDITGQTNIGGSAGLVGSKLNIFNGSDNQNILGITGADESTEYAAMGIQAGNAVITGGGIGSTNTGIIFRTAEGGTEVERLRIKHNGNVGIGTSTPSQLLELASTAPNIRLTDTVDGHSEIDGNAGSLKFNADKGNAKADSNIIFAVDNSEKVCIESSGNVGIGTSSPTAKLTVTDASGTGNVNLADFTASTANANQLIRMIGRNAANSGTTSVDFFKTYQGGFGIHNNDTDSSNFTRFIVGASERMRIVSNGNVGIGELSPGHKLVVRGNGFFGPASTTAQYQGISLQNGKDSSAAIATSYLDFRNDLGTADSHIFADHNYRR